MRNQILGAGDQAVPTLAERRINARRIFTPVVIKAHGALAENLRRWWGTARC
jgi:hypothetical protein